MCGIAGIIKFTSTSPPPWHGPRPDFSALTPCPPPSPTAGLTARAFIPTPAPIKPPP